jgi:hypothetical protein
VEALPDRGGELASGSPTAARRSGCSHAAETAPSTRAAASRTRSRPRSAARRTIVETTPALSRAGVRGLPALREVMDAAPPLLRELDPFLRGLNPALRYLAGGRSEHDTGPGHLGRLFQTRVAGDPVGVSQSGEHGQRAELRAHVDPSAQG